MRRKGCRLARVNREPASERQQRLRQLRRLGLHHLMAGVDADGTAGAETVCEDLPYFRIL